jgi:hypothetical protein
MYLDTCAAQTWKCMSLYIAKQGALSFNVLGYSAAHIWKRWCLCIVGDVISLPA